RLAFPHYMAAFFMLFFRATLRRQQLREQMSQSPLPGMLLNLLFVASGATLIAFLGEGRRLPLVDGFWNTLAYAALLIACIYRGKTLILTAAGWVLGIRQAVAAYLIMVFLALRMTGIVLLPLLILLAFADPSGQPAILTLALAASGL